jgi:uncharacterized protein
MNAELRGQLIEIARTELARCPPDPAHDINHALNVLRYADAIAEVEDADRDVTTAAALFHDVVHYLPTDSRCDLAPGESAVRAGEVLRDIAGFPPAKIPAVEHAIITHSTWLSQEPATLEAKVVRDADLLESIGALALMRTFACAGVMNLALYSTDDPLCSRRPPERLRFALDFASCHMTTIGERLCTHAARRMAAQRLEFVKSFLSEVQFELSPPELELTRRIDR